MAYSQHLYVAGETVTASTLNAATYHNWAESVVGKAAAAGEIPYATAANALAMLAVGGARKVLELNGTNDAPTWGPVRPVSGHYMGAVSSDRHTEGGKVTMNTNPKSITFANAYASAPDAVVASISEHTSGAKPTVNITATSTTGATVQYVDGTSSSVVRWLAEGAD